MNNLERLKTAVGEAPYDALLLTSEENRFYATGMHSSAGMVVITQNGGCFFTDFRYIEVAKERAEGYTIRMSSRGNGYYSLLKELINEQKIKTLGFEQKRVTVSEHDKLKKETGVRLVFAEETISALRASKLPWELERLREAQRITDKAFSEVVAELKPGMSEKRVAAEIVYRLLVNGAERVSFDPIVVSGPNSSLPHGQPGDREIRRGDFLTMDFGCVSGGYCSDMTRTVAIGKPTEEMEKVYDIVLRAQLKGIEKARAGITGKQIDAAARELIESEGYGSMFGHGFGHSLGVEIHEAPNASPSEENTIPAGAVMSAEPGIYIPGSFGVRIEDVIIIKEGGCEVITPPEAAHYNIEDDICLAKGPDLV